MDPIERSKKVAHLRELMQEKLTEWVKENEILGKGETLHFTLEVVKGTSQRSGGVKEGKPLSVAKLMPLTASDWEEILSLDWRGFERSGLEKLRRVDNKSITYRQLFGQSLNIDGYNYRFRKNNLPYRTRSDEGSCGLMWKDQRFSIWKVVSKPEPTIVIEDKD